MKSKRAVANIGKAGSKSTKQVGYVGTEKRGTKLIGKPGFTHDDQPQGHDIGNRGPGAKESHGYVRSAHMGEICGSKGK